MSVDDWDYGSDSWAAEQYEAELYDEHRKQALEEFTGERLRSFFLKHPRLARPAVTALNDARAFFPKHPGAALLFAATAMELGVKSVLLKPVVYGLVHQESAAAVITDLTMSNFGFPRFRDLLFEVLATHGGVDLRTTKRSGSQTPLWQEMSTVRSTRNALVHKGEYPTTEQAELGVAVGTTVLDMLVPAVLHRLGVHLHEGLDICESPVCRGQM